MILPSGDTGDSHAGIEVVEDESVVVLPGEDREVFLGCGRCHARREHYQIGLGLDQLVVGNVFDVKLEVASILFDPADLAFDQVDSFDFRDLEQYIFVSARSPSRTILIFSSAENFLRVAFLICLTTSFDFAI